MGDNYFCYLRIGCDEEMINEIVLIGVSFLLIANALFKFIKMRKSHNRSVTFIYAMIFNWWISNLAFT
jgi:Co/Zn/Cd efflux system component